jgi:hypothetical protein
MNKAVSLLLALVLLATIIVVTKPASSAELEDNYWTAKSPMPTARYGLGAAVVDGRIYAIGGSNQVLKLREK